MHFFDCNGFMLSPENQLKVHTLQGPFGEEKQTALKNAFWGSFEETITNFCLAQVLACTWQVLKQALKSKGSYSKPV